MKSLPGIQWRGLYNTVLLGHWPEPPREECGLNSKPEVNLKVITVKGCHLTALLVIRQKAIYWRGIWAAHLCVCHSPPIAPCRFTLPTHSGNCCLPEEKLQRQKLVGQTTVPIFAVGLEPQLNSLTLSSTIHPKFSSLSQLPLLLVSIIKLVVWKPWFLRNLSPW